MLHKRRVWFLQYRHDSRFVLVRIVLLQVSHVADCLGFLWVLPLGYFLEFSGPGLSSMSPESMILVMLSYSNMEQVLIIVFFWRSLRRAVWRLQRFWQPRVFWRYLLMMPQVKNNKVQETSNSFFNMMLQLFNIVLNIKTDLIFFIFVRFFPLVKFCVLPLRILLHALNSDQTIINTNKIWKQEALMRLQQ